MSKNQLNSPFKNPHGLTAHAKDDKDDLFDRNPCPMFDKPHDMGPNTIPVVFEEGVLGKRYYGASAGELGGAVIKSPMGGKK